LWEAIERLQSLQNSPSKGLETLPNPPGLRGSMQFDDFRSVIGNQSVESAEGQA